VEKLTSKNAIMTGFTHGIGVAIAHCLVDQGINLASVVRAFFREKPNQNLRRT